MKPYTLNNLRLSEAEGKFLIDNKEHDFLIPILNQWLKVNVEYIAENEGGVTHYWFNERANLSAFAGAIWRSGGLVCEEFVAPKGNNGKLGRIDMQFSYCEKTILVEAKHGWLYLPQKSQKNFKAEIETIMATAEKDIIHTLKADEKKATGLALTFLTPYWDGAKEYPKYIVDELENLLFLKNSLNNLSFVAYLKRPTDKAFILGKNEKEAFNSIIMLGHIISPASSE